MKKLAAWFHRKYCWGTTCEVCGQNLKRRTRLARWLHGCHITMDWKGKRK